MEENKLKENTILEVLDKNEKKQTIEVVLYFSLDTDGKDYIIYKDLSEADKDMLYASQVIEKDEEIQLNDITDEEIISQIKQIIQEIKTGDN